MKKIKLTQMGISLNELLSREQLKKVMGGDGSGGGCGDGSGCTKTSDCSINYGCFSLPGVPAACLYVALGSRCITSSDCGNGQKCVQNSMGSGYHCSL